MTVTGDVWQARVTPNNNTEDAQTVQSNNLTILGPSAFGFVNASLNSTYILNKTDENLTSYANFTAAETKEEAIVLVAKLCMRANDPSKGRAIKLTHYIDLHKRLYGVMPTDIHLLVRNSADIPITMKTEILKILKEEGWKEKKIPDPTLLPRLIRKKKGE